MVPIPYSAPPNFAAGNVLTEAQLDTLSDDITFLAGPPRVRVYNSADISIANGGSGTLLTFNSERFDSDTMHSTAANTGRITFTTAGTYLVGCNVAFASAAGAYRDLYCYLNGATIVAFQTVAPVSGQPTRLSLSTLYAFTAGQYIEFYAGQNSGAAINVTASGNYSPEAWAILQAVA